MRLHTRPGCLVVGVVLVLGSEAGEASDTASDEAAIRANVAAYEAAWNARDTAGVAATYSADADNVVFDGPRVDGREAVRRGIALEFARLPPGRRIRLSVTGIRWIRPDTAVVETTAEFNGGQVRKNRGTSVMIRENGAWLTAALRVYPAESTGAAASEERKRADADRQGVLDARAEKAAIEKLLADGLAATNQGGEAGADGYVSIVADDILWLPPNGPRVVGRKALRERMLQFTSAPHWSASWKADRVEVSASGDLAQAAGAYELSYEDASGAAVRDTGKFLDTFRKRADGRWLETVIMFSSDLPAGGGPGR